MMRRPPTSTLFPSPTLSRSRGKATRRRAAASPVPPAPTFSDCLPAESVTTSAAYVRPPDEPSAAITRSEEHTSELQSRQYLVCRLLLDKKQEPAVPLAALHR